MIDNIEKFAKIINNAKAREIVFFGGAGVSTASGVKDFRSPDGLYSEPNKYKYPPEKMLSHSFFYKKTDYFYNFYRDKVNYPTSKDGGLAKSPD